MAPVACLPMTINCRWASRPLSRTDAPVSMVSDSTLPRSTGAAAAGAGVTLATAAGAASALTGSSAEKAMAGESAIAAVRAVANATGAKRPWKLMDRLIRTPPGGGGTGQGGILRGYSETEARVAKPDGVAGG